MLEKLNRFCEMSNHEIMHRVRERWRQQTDRLRCYCRMDQADAEMGDLIRRHDSSLKAYLRDVPARRFYSSTHDEQQTREFVVSHFPEWLDGAIQEAMRLS